MWELALSFPRGQSRMADFIHALSCRENCLKQKGTMTWVIVNDWQVKQLWMRGGVGLRGLNVLPWSGRIIREYPRTAKRLNSGQARWVLFFNCFNFTLFFYPCSKNTKSDALSRLFVSAKPSVEPPLILFPPCIVGSFQLDIEQKAKEANKKFVAPNGCPHNYLFAVPELHSQMIYWAHTQIACHPGITWTLFILKQHFW